MELSKNYNPDILVCISNLSSDEVFTPPTISKLMLDNLPKEIWEDENVKFLDPVCKTGVFLREVTSKLINGLEKKIPNLETRINHILKNQVYGLSITELTAFLSRRTLYCSKYANSEFSISKFNNVDGNIKFINSSHKWNSKNVCEYCNVNKELYDRNKKLENYAYSFIHEQNLENIFDMKFDVIIGNPPYQMSDGGAVASAKPIYQKFVETAKKLNPRYLTMIIPSRWFSGGKGLDDFREEMLNDKRISKIYDFPNSSDCFPGVEIKGGVCYFLWERDYSGECEITNINNNKKNFLKRPLLEKNLNFFIRYNQSISIIQKVLEFNEDKFNHLVSSRKCYGLPTNFRGKTNSEKNKIKVYQNGGNAFINESKITVGKENIQKHKIFITKAYGAGEGFPHQILNIPFYGEPNSVCTETYLEIGPFKSKKVCENVINYIRTKFFRFLVLMIKNTQDATRGVYRLVPVQNFETQIDDEFLYKKYQLTQNEIKFIDEMIRPME
jgi:site-specific DNA-methyltransferase (adenine-specific)